MSDPASTTTVLITGASSGIGAGLAREFARRWLGDANQVSFVQVTSLSAPRRVKSREVDLAMGGLSIH